MIKSILSKSGMKMAGFNWKKNTEIPGKKSGRLKSKRFSSPFKQKRLLSGKKRKRKDLSQSYKKREHLNTLMGLEESLGHEPVIYSSVMYKYHNDTAKKVNMRISQIKKNLMCDIKKHSEKKSRRMKSLSKSLKKKETQAERVPDQALTLKPSRKMHEEVLAKFETFRKQSGSEKSDRQKESIYQTIRKASQKIREFNQLGGLKPKPERKRRNYSSVSKISSKLRGSKKKKVRRNVSNNRKHFGSVGGYKAMFGQRGVQAGPPNRFYNSKAFVVNKTKSFFKQRPREIKIKVEKEYNLDSRKTQNRNSMRLKYLRAKYQSKDKGSRKKIYTSAKSNETLKIEAIANSLNVNLDSLTETIRNKSDFENSSSLDNTREINKQLLEELKLSQMQNAKFSQIILDLQEQIKELKKGKSNHFSFKNLSSKESSFNPTVESGRNSSQS